MKTAINLEVYTFDELPKDEQEDLITRHTQCVYESYKADHIIEPFKERLEAIGFSNPIVQWDITEGVTFEATINFVKLCSFVSLDSNFKFPVRARLYTIPNVLSAPTVLLSLEITEDSEGYEKEDVRLVSYDEVIQNLINELCVNAFQLLYEDYKKETNRETIISTLQDIRYLKRAEVEAAYTEEFKQTIVII